MLEYKNINLETLANLLQVWDEDHLIRIGTPDMIFRSFDGEIFDNWEDILPITLTNSDSFFRNSSPQIENAWNYIKNKLYDENREDDYLAIIEIDARRDSLVRGIIRNKNNNIEVAINPLYEEFRPKTIIDKYNRHFCDYPFYFAEYFQNNKKYTKKISCDI